jgi:hypothetical protein
MRTDVPRPRGSVVKALRLHQADQQLTEAVGD